tara:strand:- start:159 stop:674 length:516 start_codon:yes stop_codon:yes gene_type:complete
LKKRIVKTLIASLFLIVGCTNPFSSEDRDEFATIKFDMRLNEDSNGYYHLTVDRGSWQTLHRVSGSITNEGFGVENFRVEWESNLYWYMGDSTSYIINRGINSEGQYVTRDTSYIIGFTGMEVPTSNRVSYSNSSGEFNNMIAPVRSMVGDTMKLTANWYYDYINFYIVLD